MMIVARLVCGFGIGFLLPGVPLYQAEISPPSSRGLIVGFHGMTIALRALILRHKLLMTQRLAALLGVGTMTASWFGVAFFHVPGAVCPSLSTLTFQLSGAPTGWMASPISPPSSIPVGPFHAGLVFTRKPAMA